jgi:hypothetical protein
MGLSWNTADTINEERMNYCNMKNLLILLLTFSGLTGHAQDGFTPKWGDQGDGTFRNPVLAGDYSDPDVIRVGEEYYGISSTLQESPGMMVIH